jgi:hypothetical protein
LPVKCWVSSRQVQQGSSSSSSSSRQLCEPVEGGAQRCKRTVAVVTGFQTCVRGDRRNEYLDV